MSSVGKIRKPIVLRLPASDNFNEWSNYYAPVLEDYYLDFTRLFERHPPDFSEFLEYCYNNTKCDYNPNRNRYECRIYDKF